MRLWLLLPIILLWFGFPSLHGQGFGFGSPFAVRRQPFGFGPPRAVIIDNDLVRRPRPSCAFVRCGFGSVCRDVFGRGARCVPQPFFEPVGRPFRRRRPTVIVVNDGFGRRRFGPRRFGPRRFGPRRFGPGRFGRRRFGRGPIVIVSDRPSFGRRFGPRRFGPRRFFGRRFGRLGFRSEAGVEDGGEAEATETELTSQPEQSAEDEVASSEVQVDCSQMPDGKYPTGRCDDTFVECAGGQATQGSCDEEGTRYHFNQDLCLKPADVPGCPEYDGEAGPCDNRRNGFYPDEEDCSKYFFCVDKLFFSLNCPNGTVYNKGRNRCMPPEESMPECGVATPSPFDCTDKETGVYASNTDCGIYYTCRGGTKTCKACEAGMAYNPVTELCDLAENVENCSPPKDDELAGLCFSKGKDGIYAFPDNCHQSVVCISNAPFVFFCPDSKPDFDERLLSCVEDVAGCD